MAERGTPPEADPAAAVERYRQLPEPVRIEDTIATKEVEPAPDPDAGRDAERDFMLRYAG
jgi:hypothetical protein